MIMYAWARQELKISSTQSRLACCNGTSLLINHCGHVPIKIQFQLDKLVFISMLKTKTLAFTAVIYRKLVSLPFHLWRTVIYALNSSKTRLRD